MSCDLMEINGLYGDCVRSGCVYWARLGPEGRESHQCALVYFGLVGGRSDKLAGWLLDFKLKSRAGSEMRYPCLIDP